MYFLTSPSLCPPSPPAAVGPPDVSVAGCGNCLVLQVRPLTSRWQQLERYRHMLLSVRRTRDGVQVGAQGPLWPPENKGFNPSSFSVEYFHCCTGFYCRWCRINIILS